MGKIRVNTIGDETVEQKQKEEAKKRKEAKKVVKTTEKTDEPVLASEENKVKKKVQKKNEPVARKKSARYISSKKMIDKTKHYDILEALGILSQLQKAKFDETVELHINTIDKGVSGNVTLPHGTGKQTRVAIIAPSKDQKAADELLKKIESGRIEFDILIATPDAMPKLAKVARILGPKGLMPNPKNGTITMKPEEIAKAYAGGQIAYKTEAKSPIIHVSIGKISFGKEKLAENIRTFLGSIDKTKMKNAFVKSTMSPSIKIII